jgi:hypothetical protein
LFGCAGLFHPRLPSGPAADVLIINGRIYTSVAAHAGAKPEAGHDGELFQAATAQALSAHPGRSTLVIDLAAEVIDRRSTPLLRSGRNTGENRTPGEKSDESFGRGSNVRDGPLDNAP